MRSIEGRYLLLRTNLPVSSEAAFFATGESYPAVARSLVLFELNAEA